MFNLAGEYHVILNWCPHQGGALCEGELSGLTEASFDRDTLEVSERWNRDGEIIACPRHGWSFDLKSGESISDKDVSVPTYPVEIENGTVVVSM